MKKLIVLQKLIILFIFILVSTTVFAVTIDRIEISGNRRVPDKQILNNTVKVGSELDLDKINQSIIKMYETDLFQDVKVDMELNEDLLLTYFIQEKPIINKIYFEGNDEIKSDDLQEKIPLKVGKVLDKRAIEASVMELRNAYEEENYYNVLIEYDVEERSNNSVDLIFSFKEGKEAKIEKINFYGVTAFTEEEVKKVIQTEEKGFFSWFSGSGTLKSGDLELDKDRLRGLYLNNGYLKSHVGEPEVTMNEDKTKIFVTFRVDEGVQYYVDKVTFTGNTHKSSEDLYDILSLQNSMLFNGEKYQNDIERLTEVFTSIGYAFANVTPNTDIDDETRLVNISYEIEESVIVLIDSIEINGNNKTRDRVIRRELDIVPGDKYNSIALKSSIRHLENTGNFQSVNLVEEPISSDKIRLKIDVQEQSTGTFTFGAGYSSLDGVTGMAQISQRNLMGFGYNLNLKTEISQSRTDVVLGFTNPWLFDRPITFGFDIYKLHRTYSYNGYTKDSLGFALRLGHPIIKRRLYMNYRMAFDDIDMYDMDDDVSDYIKAQEGRSKTYSFTPSIVWSSLNKPLDPSKGNKTKLFVKYAGGILGGDTHYVKTGLESTSYYPLFWKFVGMLHGEVGYAESLDGDDLPADQRYRLGGMYSVRGYEYGDISPVDETGYEYGGDKMLLFNAEMTFPLAMDGQVKGVFFYDAGQVYDNGEKYFSSGLKQAVGGGFRWYSPMGPLRLEYGRKLYPEDGESVDRWDFSVGGMF